LAIAAGLAVVGALLLVLWGVLDWPVGLAVLAVALLVLGVALGVTALVLTARVRTTVETDDHQMAVARGGRSAVARWVDVDEVQVVGHRLTLRNKEGAGLVTVLNPRVRANPVFLALMAEVQQRLDADRGYSPRR
jgi:hypothetical protein